MDPAESRRALIALLQLAYSGERAAILAYRGHARSLRRRPEERAQVLKIEDEEAQHRACVGAMLESLDAGPDPRREARAERVGGAIGLLCLVGGWLVPMYGAGALERKNIVEYENAARHATGCGRDDLVDDLLTMAEVEWEHERYFRERVLSHPLGRRIPIWSTPPPKASIREAFERQAAIA